MRYLSLYNNPPPTNIWGTDMDFELFNTWNALYPDGKVPWDPEYNGGKLLESEAYTKNYEEIDAVEEMGWDYLWLGGGHFSKQASMDPRSCCWPL